MNSSFQDLAVKQWNKGIEDWEKHDSSMNVHYNNDGYTEEATFTGFLSFLSPEKCDTLNLDNHTLKKSEFQRIADIMTTLAREIEVINSSVEFEGYIDESDLNHHEIDNKDYILGETYAEWEISFRRHCLDLRIKTVDSHETAYWVQRPEDELPRALETYLDSEAYYE